MLTARSLVLFLVLSLVAIAPATAAAAATVTSCGHLSAFEAPTAVRPIGQVRINEAGQDRVFHVTGDGTVSPPNIAAIGTGLNPVTVQLQGTPRSDGVLTNWSLTSATNCASVGALPSTSTDGNAGIGSPLALLLALVAIAVFATVTALHISVAFRHALVGLIHPNAVRLTGGR